MERTIQTCLHAPLLRGLVQRLRAGSQRQEGAKKIQAVVVSAMRRGLLRALFCIALSSALLGRATAQLGIPSLQMRMYGSHTLLVQVFPPAPPVRVTSDTKCEVLVHLLGKDIQNTWTVPAGDWLKSKSAFFDLAASNVPRFTENQQVQITVTMANQTGSVKVVRTGIIYLPVVMIPGIFNGNGGNGTWPNLEKYLITQSSDTIKQLKMLGESYRIWYPGDTDKYPTLATLSYATSSDTFTMAGDSLNVEIKWLLGKTYADRVILVTHSKGGLAARSYLTRYSNPRRVARVVMCQCPNLGSTSAPAGNLLPGVDLKNLYPLWDWLRANGKQPFTKEPNPELTTLNQWPLPNGINYYMVYSSGVKTVLTITDNGVSSKTYGYWGGDGVVTDFSQIGLTMDTNAGNKLGYIIPAFNAAYKAGWLTYWRIDGEHAGFVEKNATVQSFLWNHLLFPTNPP